MENTNGKSEYTMSLAGCFGLILIIGTLIASLVNSLIFFDMTSDVDNWDEKDWDSYNEYVDYSNYLELMVVPMIQLCGIIIIIKNLKEVKQIDPELEERLDKITKLQKRFMAKFDNVLDKIEELENK